MINHPCSHTFWSDLVHHGYLEHYDSDSGWHSVPSRHTTETMRKTSEADVETYLEAKHIVQISTGSTGANWSVPLTSSGSTHSPSIVVCIPTVAGWRWAKVTV